MAAVLRERLIALIEPLLAQLGYELVELEFAPTHGRGSLRIFIDKPGGIGLDDCERVSREISALLDVEDPIATSYALEVSSPGNDRVLRKRAHFERFVGSRVHVELTAPRAGRRRYTGKLLSVDDEGVALEVDRERVQMRFEEIGKAKLAP
jgi:ribosome maturation factor RimP